MGNGAVIGAMIGAVVIILIAFFQVAYLLGKISAKVDRNSVWIDHHDQEHAQRDLLAVRPGTHR